MSEIKFEKVEDYYYVVMDFLDIGELRKFDDELYYYVTKYEDRKYQRVNFDELAMSEIANKLGELNFETNLKIEFDKQLEKANLSEFKNSKLIKLFLNDIIETYDHSDCKYSIVSVVYFYIGKLECFNSVHNNMPLRLSKLDDATVWISTQSNSCDLSLYANIEDAKVAFGEVGLNYVAKQ